MKKRIIWMIFILISIFKTDSFCQEYIKSIIQLTFESSIDYFPSWSPDGKNILYAARETESYIYKKPSCGGDAVCVTKVPSGHPQWSPDGQYISFDNYETRSIQIISSSGGIPAPIIPKITSSKRNRHSCWSPDGENIAFYADGDICVVNLSSGIFGTIYHKDGYEARPFCWSSDGSGLLIDVRNNVKSESDIWFISSDGRTTQQVTDYHGNETTPDFSPDSSMIVFTSNLSGNQDIWVLSTNSKIKLQLTKDVARDMTPRWSPDGKKISFASERSGNRNIWIMELDIAALKRELGIKKTNEK